MLKCQTKLINSCSIWVEDGKGGLKGRTELKPRAPSSKSQELLLLVAKKTKIYFNWRPLSSSPS